MGLMEKKEEEEETICNKKFVIYLKRQIEGNVIMNEKYDRETNG